MAPTIAPDPWQRRYAAPKRRPAPRPRVTVPPDPWQKQFFPDRFPEPPRAPFDFDPRPWDVPEYGGPAYVPDGATPDTGDPPPPPFNFNTDPGYIAALAAEQAGIGQLDDLLRQRTASAFIGFGDPDWAARSGVALDPNAIAAARANYTSGNATLARLEKTRNDRRNAIINNLAGRGFLFSGALGYQEGENVAEFGRNRYDAEQAILGQLQSAREQTVSQKQALRNAVIASLQSAYQNYLANPYLYAGVGG